MKKIIFAAVIVGGVCALPPVRNKIVFYAEKFSKYYAQAESEIMTAVLVEVPQKNQGRHVRSSI